jgi:aerobic-type carbon monoxide dehydrogenase small subunit (CoxS/CutS family)
VAAEITTVEGLAHGSECIHCSRRSRRTTRFSAAFARRGMLMAAYDFLLTHPAPTEDEIREGLSAVLCGCTGYRGIVEAVKAAAAGKIRRQRVVDEFSEAPREDVRDEQ